MRRLAVIDETGGYHDAARGRIDRSGDAPNGSSWPPVRCGRGLLLFQLIGEIDRIVEPDAGFGTDDGRGNGNAQMRLPRSGQDSVTMPGVRRSRS